MQKRHLITTALTLSALTLAALSASFRAPGQESQQDERAPDWEFLIQVDVTVGQVEELAREDWEFVGYLGESAAGNRVDETLWKRPAR
jgi:hypothetical protein